MRQSRGAAFLALVGALVAPPARLAEEPPAAGSGPR